MTTPSWRRLLSTAGTHTTVRGIGLLAEFAGWIALARALGPSKFGPLAIVFAICRYVAIVADWGATTSGPRDVARHGEEAVAALVSWRRLVGVGLTAALLVVLWSSGHGALAPVAVVVLARALNLDWVLLGRGRPAVAGVSSVAQGLTLLAASPWANQVMSAAWIVGLAYGAGATASLSLAGLGSHRLRRMPVPAPWLLLGALAGQLMLELDLVLLAPLASTREAGMYAAVYRIPNAISTAVGLSLVAVLPAATRVAERDAGALRVVRGRALRVSGVAGAVVALVGAPLTAGVVSISLGQAYQPAASAAVLLMVGVGVAVAAAPLHPLQLSSGDDRSYGAALLGAAATNAALNIALIPFLGMLGAALATLVSQIQTAAHLFYIVKAGDPSLRRGGRPRKARPG